MEIKSAQLGLHFLQKCVTVFWFAWMSVLNASWYCLEKE